jgi:hypothetical protein
MPVPFVNAKAYPFSTANTLPSCFGFAISNPRFMNVDIGALLEAKGLILDQIAPLSRPQFLQKILPLITGGMDI